MANKVSRGKQFNLSSFGFKTEKKVEPKVEVMPETAKEVKVEENIVKFSSSIKKMNSSLNSLIEKYLNAYRDIKYAYVSSVVKIGYLLDSQTLLDHFIDVTERPVSYYEARIGDIDDDKNAVKLEYKTRLIYFVKRALEKKYYLSGIPRPVKIFSVWARIEMMNSKIFDSMIDFFECVLYVRNTFGWR